MLDATGTDRAVAVSLSMGAQWALWLMAHRPERVLGSVFIGPAVDLALRDGDVEDPFDEPYTSTEGWAKYNRYYWLDHYQDFLEFFFSQCFSEAHSTKQVEDAVGLGAGDLAGGPDRRARRPRARRGDRARLVRPQHAARCWSSTGTTTRSSRRATAGRWPRPPAARWSSSEGAGHIPNARDPVKVNRLIREFAGSLPAPEPR